METEKKKMSIDAGKGERRQKHSQRRKKTMNIKQLIAAVTEKVYMKSTSFSNKSLLEYLMVWEIQALISIKYN